MSDCKICGRTAVEGLLCRYHGEALNNLRATFENWKTAAAVTWEEYLDRIEDLEETGRWITEVIEHVRQQDESVIER